MQSIASFLEKFKKLEHPDHKKELMAKFIFDQTGISVAKENFQFRGKTLFIKADPYIKSELFLKKEILLKSLAGSFSDLKFDDLR
jgi:hypothetical protein